MRFWSFEGLPKENIVLENNNFPIDVDVGCISQALGYLTRLAQLQFRIDNLTQGHTSQGPRMVQLTRLG